MNYKLWEEAYIKDYRINIAEVVYMGVINNKYIQISVGELLTLAEENMYMQYHIRRICMKNSLTGKNPTNDLRAYVEEQLYYRNAWFYKKISA